MRLTEEERERLIEATDAKKIQKLHKRYRRKYGAPQGGSSRLTYFYSDELVVKLPIDLDGVPSQYVEAQFADDHPEIPVARNWMEIIDGVPVIWMERVEPLSSDEQWDLCIQDPWSRLHDGAQCGTRLRAISSATTWATNIGNRLTDGFESV